MLWFLRKMALQFTWYKTDVISSFGREVSWKVYRAWLRTLNRTLSDVPQAVMIGPKPTHDTDWITYRCFLPDLTGFVTTCCVVPDLGQLLEHESVSPQKGIQPRIERISGYRTPLASRLAQPSNHFIT